MAAFCLQIAQKTWLLSGSNEQANVALQAKKITP
jgi:hypothetical protein